MSATIPVPRRGPAAVNSMVFVTLLVLIGLLALEAPPAAPPAVAEISPQQKPIEEAPPEQTTEFGDAPGAQGEEVIFVEAEPTEAPTDEPIVAPTEILQAAVRRCVGDPPRQIEDPQAPPCVAYFAGDNGGATWGGVTADEIRIAFPLREDTTPETLPRQWQDLLTFFNSRFTFYGRTLRLIPFNTSANPNGLDQVALHRAQAVMADEELQVFGTLSYPDANGAAADESGASSQGLQSVYYDELARRGIVSVSSFPSHVDNAHIEAHAPHEWNVLPTIDRMQQHLAEYICKGWAGRPAEHAGVSMAGDERRFGAIVNTFGSVVPSAQPLVDALAACQVELAVEPIFLPYSTEDVQSAQNAILQLSTTIPPVTSVICLCHSDVLPTTLMSSATSQNYQPEWLTTTAWSMDLDQNLQILGKNTDQMSRLFGLSFYNKWLVTEDLPMMWAIREVDPAYEFITPAQKDGTAHNWYWQTYSALLMMASGLQMAGPNLTPQTFQQGMFDAKFPNPGAAGPPYFQSRVEMGPGDHAFNSDAAPTYWVPGAVSTWGSFGGSGAWCYVRSGLRHALGGFPNEPVDVSGTCY